ncbi:hypothetical protein Dda_2568 [Drechslerella dactyloides]|uniref:CHAT domain-containing protein n=1 Tax=Drechslerella dactyloides TaxID=74499 RepID=A0AAD6J189_DREDA|nr:hypothetical protein Dda_2568 [Drechslerella dactyloides]
MASTHRPSAPEPGADQEAMGTVQNAKIYLSALIQMILRNPETANMTHDQIMDMLEVELFDSAEHRPATHGYHPVARERITATILNNDDGQLWQLSRMVRRVEWAVILRRHTIAVAELGKMDKMWPALASSSPSLWYLRARVRAQQGFTSEARECWKRGLECYAGFDDAYLEDCEESVVLKLLLKLVRERGDEGRKHSAQFEKMLVEGYYSFVRWKEPHQVGYFHCDLARVYLDYLPTLKARNRFSDSEPEDQDKVDRQLRNDVMDVVCHHIQAGHIFAVYNLIRYIYKSVGGAVMIHYVIDWFGKSLANARNQELLLDFFLGQIYYFAACNVLKDNDEAEELTPQTLDYAAKLFKAALKHTKASGDVVTGIDIQVMEYVISAKLKVDAAAQVHKTAFERDDYWYNDIANIKKHFDKFLKKYGKREDAMRIGLMIDRFHELFKITKDSRACFILPGITAYHQRATGEVRWSLPYWVMAASGRRRGELLRALEGCNATIARLPDMTFGEKHHLLKTQVRVCHRLGKLAEGIKTARKLIILCDERKKRREGSEARFDYLLLKTDLMATCVKEKDREPYILKLMGEFDRFQTRDENWMPTSRHTVMKTLLRSAFLTDNAHEKCLGVTEVWRSQRQYEVFKDNFIFRLNMSPAEKDFMDIHQCFAQYVAGERLTALQYCEKMAGNYYTGQTELEAFGVVAERRRRLRMAANWQLLYIFLYVQEFDFVMTYLESEGLDNIKGSEHKQFWRAMDDLYNYYLAVGEQRNLARLFFQVGKFCARRKRSEEALSFWIVALEHLAAVERFGIVGGATEEYMPAIFRSFSFDELFKHAIPTQMNLDREERSKLAMDGTFYWTQSKKAHEFRRILGSNSIWEDWKALVAEFETVLEYTAPPLPTEVHSLVKRARELFGPDGYGKAWSSDKDKIETAERKKLAEVKVLIEKLDKTESLRAPLSAFSASPPFVGDLFELRSHRIAGQSIVYVDYLAVGKEVFMLYNVENKQRRPFSKDQDYWMEYGTINMTVSTTKNWTEGILAKAMANESIENELSMGAKFVAPILKISRPGDMIVIGNSWFTSRIPFHALQIGYDDESGGMASLCERNNVIYTPTVLALKHCMERLTRFRARLQSKIPRGAVRTSICGICPANATSLEKNRMTAAARVIEKEWNKGTVATFVGSKATPTAVKDQLMQTTDFVHFLGEVDLQPKGDEPSATRVKLGPKVSMTAGDIARNLRFSSGNSPVVCMLYIRADKTDDDVKGKSTKPAPPPPTLANIPDGVVPAFIQAGAGTVISTLWPVPVKVAVRFGELLHSDFKAARKARNDRFWDIASAVHGTACQLRDEIGEGSPHWAAFVTTGAWVRGTNVGGRLISEGRGMKTDSESYRL